MRIELHPKAEAEANASTLWYERRHEGLGDDFSNEVERAIAVIAAAPRRNPPVEESAARVLRLNRFPFRVVYEVGSASERKVDHFGAPVEGRPQG